MSEALIEAHNLNVYYDAQCVLKDVNISIRKNQTTAFMGPSGVGKSSLLRVLSGQQKPHSGKITYHSQLQKKHHKSTNIQTGILFQNNALLLHLSVFENVALPIRYHYDLPENTIREIVMMKLHAVNLENAADLYPEQLSGGMARRAAIARSIALDPELIFYDEPFAGQDPINAEALAQLIKKMNLLLNATNIIITHEAQLTLKLADYLYIFDKQSIAFQGTPSEIEKSASPFVQAFLNPKLMETVEDQERKA